MSSHLLTQPGSAWLVDMASGDIDGVRGALEGGLNVGTRNAPTHINQAIWATVTTGLLQASITARSISTYISTIKKPASRGQGG